MKNGLGERDLEGPARLTICRNADVAQVPQVVFGGGFTATHRSVFGKKD
jgi:hypothetical protein